MSYLSIKNWSEDERPREKLVKHSPRFLTDAELIAIIIGSGTRDLSAVELSRKILSQNSNSLAELGKLNVNELKKVKGIGEAKAVSIVAALEIGRRRLAIEPPSKPKINSSHDASAIFKHLISDLQYEEFWVAYLNRSNTLIERIQISQGGISGTVIDIRLIIKKAIELLASSIILCHNHPSGNLRPSNQDILITKKIKDASKLFDIKVLDHIIITNSNYMSFADQSLILNE